MTRIIDKIRESMSHENLLKKRNIVDKEPEVGKLKLKEGSIMEYIPGYNNMFNKGKHKVFPLQSLEEIMVDNSKYTHTKKKVLENIAAKKEKEGSGAGFKR